MPHGWAKAAEGGLTLSIRLTPKSSRDAMEPAEATADGRVFLKSRVRAAPEDGKANAALEALVAKIAGVPKSSVSVIAGHSARLKTIRIACTQEEVRTIAERLEDAVSP